MVRPGTILAVGAHAERPDYDFYENVRLLVYLPEEHGKAETSITDQHGNVVMHVFAERDGSEVKVRVDSEHRDYTIEALGADGLTVTEMI